MAKRKLSPVVQAMTLFNQLDERDKLILADYIRAQTATPRKAATKKKKDTPLLVPDGTQEPMCGACGNNAEYQDHFAPSPNYHEFEAPKAKKARAASAEK